MKSRGYVTLTLFFLYCKHEFITVPFVNLTALSILEQNTYNNCPICGFPLTCDSAVCPRCGNDILEDITTLDEQSQEIHRRNIEEKKAEWYTRCITENLGVRGTNPGEDGGCIVKATGSRHLYCTPEEAAFLATCTRTALVEDIAMRRKWWQCLSSDWKEVVKSTLKLVRDPGEGELLDFFATTHLRCDNRRVHDLLPVRVLDHLQQLRCDESPVENLEPLAELLQLQRLYAFDCDIVSLEPLRKLKNLKLLWISSTPVTSIEPLQELVNLEELYCSETSIADFSPLKSLVNLEKLSCYKTEITSIEALGSLENLIELGINNTRIEDLSPIGHLENLEYLRCSKTGIDSLEPLRNMRSLRELSISRTHVTSLEPLAGLGEIEEIDISYTPVRSIEPLMHLGYLEKLELSAGQIPDIEIERFIELHPGCEIILKS